MNNDIKNVIVDIQKSLSDGSSIESVLKRTDVLLDKLASVKEFNDVLLGVSALDGMSSTVIISEVFDMASRQEKIPSRKKAYAKLSLACLEASMRIASENPKESREHNINVMPLIDEPSKIWNSN